MWSIWTLKDIFFWGKASERSALKNEKNGIMWEKFPKKGGSLIPTTFFIYTKNYDNFLKILLLLQNRAFPNGGWGKGVRRLGTFPT